MSLIINRKYGQRPTLLGAVWPSLVGWGGAEFIRGYMRCPVSNLFISFLDQGKFHEHTDRVWYVKFKAAQNCFFKYCFLYMCIIG